LHSAVRKSRRVKLRAHDVGQSLSEGLLARGDRHLAGVLLRLFREGARFDAWDEHFDRRKWARALSSEGVDPDAVLHRPRGEDETLPWDHLGAPVSRDFLASEWRKSQSGDTTPNCMDGKCHHCGVDVKECGPSMKVHRDAKEEAGPSP
ncbi:MAG: TIGR03960 family B12-binding radical SAM protein, partial [Planctomycetota bacterium]